MTEEQGKPLGIEENDIRELTGLLLALQKELQDFRKENQVLQADLNVLKKIFSYKVKKVTNEEIAEGKLNAWRMRMYAKCEP